MEMEMRVRGNNAEKELAEIGVDEKREAGALGEAASGNRRQDCVPLAACGNVGKGWPFEWRRERNTRSFFHL